MPEKDKNQQEGPDVRDNLIRISVGGETVFVDANQYKAKNAGQTAKLRKMKRQPKNPKPGEWISEDYSKHKIADYKPFNFVDGEGVRCSLYVSGCLFDCPGCYNLAAQNFNYGRPYTQAWRGTLFEYLGLQPDHRPGPGRIRPQQGHLVLVRLYLGGTLKGDPGQGGNAQEARHPG